MNSILNQPEPNSCLNILVVEDDLIFNMLYKKFLGVKGAQVESCLSLADAERVLNTAQVTFDAVILDNQLGDGEGISLLPALQALESVSAVVMVSGNDDPDFFITAFNAGIHDYMVKPVNLELLWLKITNSVNQQRLKKLSEQQNAELERWVEQEQQEQVLAKHLFDNMFNDLNRQHNAVHAWLQSHSVFSGDAILRCQGADGSWYFMLADAMGHGLAPAISLMPMLQTFQQLALKAIPLSNVVHALNNVLYKLLPDDRFVAAVLLRIHPSLSEIEVWNGGMPDVLFLNTDKDILHAQRSSHMALGILSDNQISVCPQTLSTNDTAYILMHSDGLTETQFADGSFVDIANAISLLDLPSAKPLKALRQHFSHCAADDDISLCLVDINALTPPAEHNPSRCSKDSSFNVQFTLRGNAMVNTDLPGKAVDLLRAQNVPLLFLQRVFTVITELYVNAFEHGVLELDSAIKAGADGFIRFYEEKEQRILHITEQQYITLQMQWSESDKLLRAEITDSGKGFTKSHANTATDTNPYGRGLSLIDQLTDSFEIIAPGNRYQLVMSLTESVSH